MADISEPTVDEFCLRCGEPIILNVTLYHGCCNDCFIESPFDLFPCLVYCSSCGHRRDSWNPTCPRGVGHDHFETIFEQPTQPESVHAGPLPPSVRPSMSATFVRRPSDFVNDTVNHITDDSVNPISKPVGYRFVSLEDLDTTINLDADADANANGSEGPYLTPTPPQELATVFSDTDNTVSPFACDVCGASFDSDKELENHWQHLDSGCRVHQQCFPSAHNFTHACTFDHQFCFVQGCKSCHAKGRWTRRALRQHIFEQHYARG